MSEGDETPPGAPPEPTEEQQRQFVLQMMRQTIGGDLVGLVSAFKPDLKISRQSFESLVEVLVSEQLMVGEQILPRLTTDVDKQPYMIIDLKNEKVGIKFQANKQIGRCNSPQEVLEWALLMAFLSYPPVRGVLRIFGWSYQFQEPKEKSPIVMV